MIGDDLTIAVPIWRRYRNLPRLIGSVMRTVPGAEIVFVVNRDEQDDWNRMVDVDAVVTGTRLLPVDWPGGSTGDYAKKVNAAYRASDRSFIFTGADDIVFQPGWYEAARALIGTGPYTGRGVTVHNPDAIGVVGTVDDCNPRTINGLHSTHSLVARWYADQGGSVDQSAMIYHEGYDHEYCDDELVQTAIKRQAYAHAFDSHVSHLHPIHPVLEVPDDETYQRGRSRTRQSRQLYMRRRRLWRYA